MKYTSLFTILLTLTRYPGITSHSFEYFVNISSKTFSLSQEHQKYFYTQNSIFCFFFTDTLTCKVNTIGHKTTNYTCNR